MTKLPSMPLFPADFFADTAHISGEAAGIYLVLLGHAWLRGGTLPNDSRAWARLARVGHQRWTAIRDEIQPFWQLGPDGLYRQKRQFKDYQAVLTKVGTCSQNGIKGNEKRWGKKSFDFKESDIANGIATRQFRDRIPEPELKKESLNGELRQERVNSQVYVNWDTPQWNAWEDFYRKTYAKPPPKDSKGGWYFPTEYPPPTPS